MALSLATATLIGSGIGAVGSLVGAHSAGKDAARAQRDATALGREELAFAKERYGKWEAIFGPIQENLSNFYQNFDADTVAATGLEAYDQEFMQARDQIEANFAQRGLGESGVAAAAEMEGQFARASERARIRAKAPMTAARERMQFLSLGLGQGQRAEDNIQNTMGRLTNQAYNRAGQLQQTANQATADASAAVGSTVNAVLDRFTEAE